MPTLATSKKMNSKTIYLLTILSLTLYSCERFYDREYNTPINTIENIKTKNSYNSMVLTIEKYLAKDKEILASFIYKNKKASVKLNFELSKNKLEFINIGEESDYFLYAISELFEEKLLSSKMKDVIVFSLHRKGDNPKINLFNNENEYVLFYKPHPDEKGSVDIRMKIDMELGKIALWEKNGGIAKKNFVKAFKKTK